MARPLRHRWHALVSLLAFLVVPSARAQPAEDGSPRTTAAIPRVVLVQPLEADRARSMESLASALRGQLAPDLAVGMVAARPATEDGEARIRWGTNVARREEAVAVLWLEEGEQPGEATLWIVEAGADPSRLRRVSVTEPNAFDRDRTLAIAARAMLRDVGGEARRGPGETTEGAEGERADAPPTPPEEAAPSARSPAARSSEGRTAAVAPAPERAEKAPRPRFHGTVGPVLRMGGAGAVPGWRAAAGVRAWRHLHVRASLALLREETLQAPAAGPEVARNRLPVALEVLGHLPLGRWHLEAGGALSVVAARLSGQGTGGSPRSVRAVGLTAGAVGSLSVEVAAHLFVAIEAAVHGRVAEPRPSAVLGAPPVPAVEGAVALSLGFGRP